MENADTNQTQVNDTQQPKQETGQAVETQQPNVNTVVEVIPKVIKDYVDGMVASAMDRILSTPTTNVGNKDGESEKDGPQKESFIL